MSQDLRNDLNIEEYNAQCCHDLTETIFSKISLFSAIQRGAADAPADERRAEGGERAVAGRAGGHEPRAEGDESGPGGYLYSVSMSRFTHFKSKRQ